MAVDEQKQQVNRMVWSAGNWDEIADYVAQPGGRLLDAIGLEPGMKLLDVGTGSGGAVSIPAAQRGAEVIGSDITSAHFEAARSRADAAGVDVEWVEADALDLPFGDDAFDRVCSTFGHMFAPDHELAAAEMVRVCKPGGTIGFCAWTPEGSTGQMFRLVTAHMPPPPDGFQPPPLWGSEQHVRSLLEPHGIELTFERALNVFEDESLERYSATMENSFPPMVMAKQALGDDWAALKAELDEFFAGHNTAEDGAMHVEGEYLLAVGRKPG